MRNFDVPKYFLMASLRPADKDFLDRITKLIEDNLSNEQFGVSELADKIGMSRSNLLRKIQKATGKSASQFIRSVRLREAMILLEEGSHTVSEVGFKVGFNSSSYFIKCFHEEYGYPPGEVGKHGCQGTCPNRTSWLPLCLPTLKATRALMQKDEKKAILMRDRHREIFNATTEKYRGTILQYYGDGTLSIFQSAIDAVRCAIEMQGAFRVEPEVPVRIGIHSGDVIVNEEGVIGDGVNVASRIESQASSGSILISDKVFDEVKNQSGIQTKSLGTVELKNVGKPIELYAISNSGLVLPELTSEQPVPEDTTEGQNSPGQ